MSTSRHQPASSEPARPTARISSSSCERSAPTLAAADASALANAAWNGFEIRPTVPADAELIVAALAYTSSETYYRRFHVAKRQFTRNELTNLTEVDGTTHVALVAIEPAQPARSGPIGGAQPARLAAEARFCIDPSDSREGELGICVHDPFRRQRLGAEMLRRLCACAASRGVTRLRAIVQSDNIPMRALLYHVFPDTRVEARYEGEIDYLLPVWSLLQGERLNARTEALYHSPCPSRSVGTRERQTAGRRGQALASGSRNAVTVAGAIRATAVKPAAWQRSAYAS